MDDIQAAIEARFVQPAKPFAQVRPIRGPMGYLISAAIVVAALVLAVMLLTNFLQQALLYHPDTRRTLPGELGLAGVEERVFAARDGSEILTWAARPAPGRPTILYFHGNGGSFIDRAERIRKYTAKGYGMVMLTWRGFGGRTGRPSERANVSDAEDVYEALVAEGVKPESIVVYGESLGTGVAAQLAAKKPVAALVLDAPYTSIVAMAERYYPYLPARWLMTDRYETMRYLSRITAPALVIHGEADEIIPTGMGREVARGIGDRATFVSIPGAGHTDHYMFGSFEIITAWLDERFPPTAITGRARDQTAAATR
ncbi:MAG: alpha/beta fold hydrolase [Hyphomicrobium sp.]|nr:alpha/beta fold hydrolase [Hyphomicrobium sp.]